MDLVDEYLSRLENAGLIRVAQLEPELEYLFRHEMIRDAIYNTMVKHNRKELHRAAGAAIESLFPDRLDDLAPALAYHYTEADDADNGLKYATLAGDIAYRRFANAEAAAQYARALDVAKRHNRRDKLAYLHEKLGHALEHTGRHAEAVANYGAMRAAAREVKDEAMELQAIVLLMTIHATPTAVFDMAAAERLGEEGSALARKLGDRQAEAACFWNLSNLYSHSGIYGKAVSYGERSIAIARELGAREQLAYSLNDLASFAYINDYQLESGLKTLTEARQLWIELDDKPMLADCLSTTARYDMVMGDYDAVLEHAAEAWRIAESIDNPWGRSYSRFVTGVHYFERGEIGKAFEDIETCLLWGDRAGFVAPRVGLVSNWGLMHGLLGQPQRGLPLARQALELTAKTLTNWLAWPQGNFIRLLVIAGELKAAKSELKKARTNQLPNFLEASQSIEFGAAEYEIAAGNPAQAERLMSKFTAKVKESSADGYLSAALPILARAQIEQGKNADALATLTEARALAEKLNARWQLWQILAMLAQVDDANQDSLRAQAREVVAFIAERVSDTSLRESFLSRAEVKALA